MGDTGREAFGKRLATRGEAFGKRSANVKRSRAGPAMGEGLASGIRRSRVQGTKRWGTLACLFSCGRSLGSGWRAIRSALFAPTVTRTLPRSYLTAPRKRVSSDRGTRCYFTFISRLYKRRLRRKWIFADFSITLSVSRESQIVVDEACRSALASARSRRLRAPSSLSVIKYYTRRSSLH